MESSWAGRRHGLWSTPVLVGTIDATVELDALASLILGRVDFGSPVGLSNVGAVRTRENLLQVESEAVEWLHRLILTTIRKLASTVSTASAPTSLLAEAWGNVYQDGDYQQPHLHHNSAWSGVLYVRAPTSAAPAVGGDLELYDPRPASAPYNCEEHVFRVRPAPGMIVAFPSWLMHAVTPYRGATPRVSIAFNATAA